MKRMTGDQRRKRILEAALDVFSRKGPGGARIKEIAALSGNSETLIYRHFPGKDDLYEACLEHLTASHPALDDVAEAMARSDDQAVLAGLAEHILHHSRQDPSIVRLSLYQALERLDGADARPPRPDRSERGLAEYLEQAKQAGRLSVDEPALAAKLFLYLVSMCVLDRQVRLTPDPPGMDDQDLAHKLAALFLHGLRPRGA